MERDIEVMRRNNRRWVPALVRSPLTEDDLDDVEAAWGASRQRIRTMLQAGGVPRAEWPQSLHWDWQRKSDALLLLEVCVCGVMIDDAWQAVMLTKSASYSSRLEAEAGKPLVYVDFLEVAPWNWQIPALGQEGTYRGLGSILFMEAIRQSKAEMFKGRVGLHALPQAEAFYRNVCRMVDLGPDASKQNLRYFELSPLQAEEHLKGGGGQ